jgi:hypothetical protein
MRSVRSLALAGFIGVAAPIIAAAQPLGTFRWQIQPYCNILSISVVQQGSLYLLNGNDDQCAAPQQASVVGLAFQNPNGTIGFGLTVVTAPGGTPVHIDATITLTTLGGTWRDSAGNNGVLTFTPGAGAGGAPRPVPTGGLPPGSVTSVQLAAGSVTTAQLAAGSVTTGQLAAGSVTTAQLADHAVDSTKIANNAIVGAHVQNGSLSVTDLLDPPRAASAGGNQASIPLGAAAVIRSVTLSIPASGRVIAFANGYFDFNSAAQDGGRCSITTGNTVDTDHNIIADDGGHVAATNLLPFAGTRGFIVGAGSFTINLVCDLVSGVVDVNDTNLTAIYVS